MKLPYRIQLVRVDRLAEALSNAYRFARNSQQPAEVAVEFAAEAVADALQESNRWFNGARFLADVRGKAGEPSGR